jgi:fatty-acyl-CoA synthase
MNVRSWWWFPNLALNLSAASFCQFFDGKVPRWWAPDDVQFVESIPLGATGKMLKNRLREQFKDLQSTAP